MTSLRARLVAGLLALAAVGLLTLGGITYAEQRSFLFERVDGQLCAAPASVAHALAERDVGPGFPDRHGPGHRGGPPGADALDRGLPSGTYGQRRGPDGGVLGALVITYGERVAARPALPPRLPVDRPFTVGALRGDGSYRVIATADPARTGTTVVAVPLRDTEQILHRLLLVEGLVIAAVLLVLGLLAGLLVRIGLLPLERMARTAGAIAGGDLSHRVTTTDPRTEVGRLGRALNAMLERLEGAFAERRASEERLRRFIADASHELRTPLASIRGYAELYRMGAARGPAGTERAMRRIEEEAARMGVLVEDLLALARLDEVPDAPAERVDLAALARDAVDDARVTAPDREIDVAADGEAAVLGDAHRLRQVLANLLRNALVHTPAGTPVEASVARRGLEVVLEVRDHGPGLPTAEPDALFERFWRAEGGRERGKGGAGLGLAIVAAIADGHGGRVTAADAPGGGALFTVRLPAAEGSGIPPVPAVRATA